MIVTGFVTRCKQLIIFLFGFLPFLILFLQQDLLILRLSPCNHLFLRQFKHFQYSASKLRTTLSRHINLIMNDNAFGNHGYFRYGACWQFESFQSRWLRADKFEEY